MFFYTGLSENFLPAQNKRHLFRYFTPFLKFGGSNNWLSPSLTELQKQ